MKTHRLLCSLHLTQPWHIDLALETICWPRSNFHFAKRHCTKMPNGGRNGRPGGQLDIEGVLDEWDSTTAIRDRLREGGRLVETGDCTVKLCGQYAEVLGPIILRMAGGPNKVPDVNPLRQEISYLYVKNKQDKSVEHQDVIDDGWIIRKMCGFVKMKVRREEVSVVGWLHFLTSP